MVTSERSGYAQPEGFTVWLTGLPCSGKSTIARALAQRLLEQSWRVEVLDGDEIRETLCQGLGFSREDRDTNVRRIAYVAKLLTRNGVATIVAAVSPYASARAEARATVGRFLEVYVRCPTAECERRDVKGMYARARAGELRGFTGVEAPYEAPTAPDLLVDTDRETVDDSVHRVLSALEACGFVSDGAAGAGAPTRASGG